MHNEILIKAEPQRIYAFASATERWPEYLPHYRFVHVLEDDGARRVVEMGARRDVIPVRWTAEQWNDPNRPSIRFRHIAGWTRGMEVEWRFERDGVLTRTIIDHELSFRFPIVRGVVGRRIVGDFFIHTIAAKTLARIKELAEQGDHG